MKDLQKQFDGKGEVRDYSFRQIRAADKAFVYEVSSGNSNHYEVFLRKENRRYACISYPTAKAFGTWAWTYMTLEKAEKKFKNISEIKKSI